MQGEIYAGATMPRAIGLAHPDWQTAGSEGFLSLSGVGAGGCATAGRQNTLIRQQQVPFADASAGVDLTSMSVRSIHTTASSAPVQNGASDVYRNPKSTWVQHADSGGEPWFYNLETAEVSFSPPREGVRER